VLTENGILNRLMPRPASWPTKSALPSSASAFTTSPWRTTVRFFCLSEEGQTYVIAAGKTFKQLHVNELDEMAQATPALARRAFFYSEPKAVCTPSAGSSDPDAGAVCRMWKAYRFAAPSSFSMYVLPDRNASMHF